jgi:hypothetical protein
MEALFWAAGRVLGGKDWVSVRRSGQCAAQCAIVCLFCWAIRVRNEGATAALLLEERGNAALGTDVRH